jgi:hypothetical protein
MLAENTENMMKQKVIGNKELSERSGLPLGTLNEILSAGNIRKVHETPLSLNGK